MKIRQISQICADLKQNERRLLITKLLMQQHEQHGDNHCICKHGTLICLKHGIVKGSEICPSCHGWIGRDPVIENWNLLD